MVVDDNYDKIENWKDLQDRSRPYNSYIKEGGFNPSSWKSANKYNKTEKKKKHKNRSDTFVEFRVDKIRRANFNSWGFELYSPTISMIGFHSRYYFPYVVNDIQQDPMIIGGSGFGPNNVPPVDEDGIFMHKVTWQGGSFNVPEFDDSEEISQLSTGNAMHTDGSELGSDGSSSYWDYNEDDEENDLFDEEMYNMLLDDREKDDTILDVGQKKVNLYFGD